MTFLTENNDVRNDMNHKRNSKGFQIEDAVNLWFHSAEELHSSFNKRPRSFNGKNRRGDASPFRKGDASPFRKGDASPAYSHGQASPGGGQRTPGGGVKKDLRRTVFIYGIPEKMTPAQVRQEAASQGGEIKGFHMEGDDDGPHRPSAVSVMAKKLGRPEADIRKEGLKTAFVVMSSQGQATKLVKGVKGRGRVDGTGLFRCIHKYDYMKSIRKSPSARSIGFTPRFSPKPMKVPGSAPLGPQHRQFNRYDSRRRHSAAPSPTAGSPVFREIRPNLRTSNTRFPKWTRPRSAPGPRPLFAPRSKREDMNSLSLMPSTISESSRFSSARIIRRTSTGNRDQIAKGPVDNTTQGFFWSRAGRVPKSLRTTHEHEEGTWGDAALDAIENIAGSGMKDMSLPSSIRDPLPPPDTVPEWQVVSDPETEPTDFGLSMSNRSLDKAASSFNSEPPTPMNFSGEDEKEQGTDGLCTK